MADFRRDLLGDPIDPGHGQRGRPRHVPTDAQRRQVQALRDEGRSHSEIAAALGITQPTLRLYYPGEIGSRSQAWRRHAADLPTDGDDNYGKTD